MWHSCDSGREHFGRHSPSNMTSRVHSCPSLPWGLYRCSGWSWAGLGHPLRRGCEARAEATDHFSLSPTKRSKSEVDLASQPPPAEISEAIIEVLLLDHSRDYSTEVLSADDLLVAVNSIRPLSGDTCNRTLHCDKLNLNWLESICLCWIVKPDFESRELLPEIASDALPWSRQSKLPSS